MHDEQNYLDQSSLAACSFAGFLQLLHLSSALSSLDVLIPSAAAVSDSQRWSWWSKHWGATWRGILETKEFERGDRTPHVEDIAHMLDLLPNGLWHRAPHPSFVYAPVRSAGNSEMSFDQRRYVIILSGLHASQFGNEKCLRSIHYVATSVVDVWPTSAWVLVQVESK